jgi:potassium/hydrogen antiporter
MDSSYLIIGLSLSVLISYAFDLFSSRFKTPSVILLLGVGMLIRQLTGYFDVQIPFVAPALSTLGTLGLILIVLEGGLDLELQSAQLGLLRRTALTALGSLVITTLLIALVLFLLLEETFARCLLNALPFGVISRTVALPGIQNLSDGQREFALYESTLSDILGVMLFNFVLLAQSSSVLGATLLFTRDIIVISVVSVVCCFGLLYLISRINHPVKFLPIISVLLLIYAIAQIYQMSSLLIILVFGLFLNNTELFIRGRLDQIFKNDLFEKELDQLKNLTAEGGFVIRTFFFLLFGYSANLLTLIDLDAIIVSVLFVGVIIGVRYLALRLMFAGPIMPLLWVAPRGLLTILLYLNIPDTLKLTGFREGVLMLTVVLSALVMMGGLIGKRSEERV